MTVKKEQVNTKYKHQICRKSEKQFNDQVSKQKPNQKNLQQKDIPNSSKQNIDTTTYHSTLPDGPGSSLRSELWAIIIATATIP
jgi:hypothetical protein